MKMYFVLFICMLSLSSVHSQNSGITVLSIPTTNDTCMVSSLTGNSTSFIDGLINWQQATVDNYQAAFGAGGSSGSMAMCKYIQGLNGNTSSNESVFMQVCTAAETNPLVKACNVSMCSSCTGNMTSYNCSTCNQTTSGCPYICVPQFLGNDTTVSFRCLRVCVNTNLTNTQQSNDTNSSYANASTTTTTATQSRGPASGFTMRNVPPTTDSCVVSQFTQDSKSTDDELINWGPATEATYRQVYGGDSNSPVIPAHCAYLQGLVNGNTDLDKQSTYMQLCTATMVTGSAPSATSACQLQFCRICAGNDTTYRCSGCDRVSDGCPYICIPYPAYPQTQYVCLKICVTSSAMTFIVSTWSVVIALSLLIFA